MKKLLGLLVVFCVLCSVARCKAYDYFFGFHDVFASNALDHVVEQVNAVRTVEPLASYWHPIASDTEARITQRFSFDKPTAQIRLNASISVFNFAADEFGSGSLHASTDGINWIQLLNATITSAVQTDYFYATNLPASLVGNKEIWIQARLQSTGQPYNSQFLRQPDPNSTLNVFELGVDFPPPVIHRASATLQIVNGFIVGVTVLDGGYGYSEAPAVLIDDPNGTGAVVTAQVENGVVVGFQVIDAGNGYGAEANLRIASPPFTPTLSIAVSKVNVTLHVTLGRKYQLESTEDLKAWTPVGSAFVAADEVIVQEFPVTDARQIFRIQEIP